MTSQHRPASNLDFEHAYHQYNRVQNDDPTNEYMYQMPLDPDNGDGTKGDGDGDTYVINLSAPLDLHALHQRLQVLGLNAHSSESLLRLHRSSQTNGTLPALGSAFRTNPISPHHLLSPPETSRSHPHPLDPYQPFSPPFEQHHLPHTYQRQPSFSPPQKPPTAIDLGPSDSLSQMYRPYLGPVESERSKGTRRGGTNVDPVDGQAYRDDYENEHNSAWETRHHAPSDAPELEEMTMGRTEWANDTMGGDMLDMRERLINNSQIQHAHETAAINQHIADASTLAAALTKLEATQGQLRTLQATLIAERVARTQMKRRSHEGDDDVREVKNELAGAVRALRRAKEEAKRAEEEKRRLAKCFEDTKVQLYKYHEELRVRDARSRGREEGRAEAWQEAERWMGQSPPIPHTDPIQTVPQAVLRRTPLNELHTLPSMQQQPPPQPQQPQQNQQPFLPQQPSGNMAPMMQSPPSLHTLQTSSGFNGNGSSGLGQHQQQQQQHMMPGSLVGHGSVQHQQPQSQTTYQPMIIPINPMPQQPQLPQHTQQFQPSPAQPPHSQNIPRSAPHRLNPLPPQHPSHHAQPQRAATVISRTPQNPYAAPLPSTQGHQRSTTLGSFSVHPLVPASVPQHNAAESYLERIDHDPHVQHMLQSANDKTFHTSAFSDLRPPTGSRSVSAPLDTPLPTSSPHGQNHVARQSRSGTMGSTKPKGPQQRYSLLEQLHGHPRNESNLNGEDRYPAFPHQKQAQGHMRGASFDSVNPAAIALPHSTAGSVFDTPQTKVSRRSKVAGALRGGTDIDDLSDIAEEEREARRSFLANMQGGMGQDHHHHHPQQQQQQQPPMTYQTNQPRQKSNYAPSMPPMRGRPVTRMPQPLGMDGKAPSEPHAQPLQPKQGLIASLFNRHPTQDPNHAPDHMTRPIDIQGQGHRTSALGLEGLEDQAGHRHQARSRAGTMESTKAPTIMIQPPSSQNISRTQTSQAPLSSKSKSQPLPPPHTQTPTLLPHGPTKRQTTIVTEYYDQAHAIPLPRSQPHAPTVYSGFSPDRAISPHDLPSLGETIPGVSVIDYALRQALPDSRPTTMYSAAPPRVTMATETDIDEPPRFKHPAKQAKRKPTLTIYGHNNQGAAVDPRSVPLPASRAPTHRPRTSTYAGTVATIDEVTEEESAMGNKGRRR